MEVRKVWGWGGGDYIKDEMGIISTSSRIAAVKQVLQVR